MALPYFHNAFVEDNKIISYLLNLNHKDGGPKANFFFKFGFTEENIEPFRASLLNHAAIRDIATFREDEFGETYTLICSFETPDLRNPCIKTVWIINTGDDRPRLVTAFPQ